jgi:hypothetical protein
VYPPAQQFGGGLVYLIDRETRECLASSWVSAGKSGGRAVNRSFGIGYRTVEVVSTDEQLRLQHHLWVPFGDDPVVISSVSVTSLQPNKSIARELSVIEVWGTLMWQQQCSGPSSAIGSRAQDCTYAARRAFQRSHYTTTTTVSGSGLVSHTVAAANVSSAQPTHWDATPPDTFLFPVSPTASAARDGKNTAATVVLGCDAESFFGTGGAAHPTFKVSPCASSSDHGAMIIERPVSLSHVGALGDAKSAAESMPVELHQAYGYVPSSFSLGQLQRKYGHAEAVTRAREAQGTAWKSGTIGFAVPSQPAIGREVAWNAGYLRQALTRYDFFNESMLDQGSQYRYAAGFEGAFRDPMQHALPLVLMAPERASSILRMALSQLCPPAAWGPPRPAGPYSPTDDAWSTPYALYGSGRIDNIFFGVQLAGASDLELYLLLLASEYVLATKDTGFLAQRIPYRFKVNRAPPGQTDRSVLQVLADACRYLANHTSVGPHGLIRVQSGDWNDGFSTLAGCGSNKQCQHQVQLEAESVMNSAMAAYILPRFAQVLDLAVEANATSASQIGLDSATVRAFAASQRVALQNFAWNGDFLNRAWLPHKGFVGTNAKGDSLGMTLEPQAWALLSGCLNASQQHRMIASMESHLGVEVGGWRQSRTGHFWAALSHPTIMGVAEVNKSAAWQKWIQTSLAHEASRFPNLWPGVWTAADYIDPASGRSGGSGFPALCTHRHAWPLYSLAKGLVGLDWNAAGLLIRPGGLPISAPRMPYEGRNVGTILWAFTSALVNVSAHGPEEFAGRYRPLQRTSNCAITVELLMADLSPRSAVHHRADAAVKRVARAHVRVVDATANHTATAREGAWRAGLESVVVDEQGRSAVRFELQPGGDGHCGEDLAVEWHVKM